MNPHSIRFLSVFILSLLLISPRGWSKEEVDEYDYLRYTGDEKRGRLETAIVTMEKAGVTVDLIGAVHIADAAYYKELTGVFTGYEALLFELVDGQRLKRDLEGEPEEEMKVSTPDTAGVVLHSMMKNAGSFLQLQFQSDGINYQTENFVHADVSWARFKELQEEMGESWGSLMQKAMRAELERQGKAGKASQPRFGMLLAGMFGDPSALKIVFAKQLAGTDDLAEVFENEDGGSVIIGERNKRALEVLDEELGAGRKKLGIFYGAGHMPDMQKRMEVEGWKRVGEKWLTAWDIQPKVLWKKK